MTSASATRIRVGALNCRRVGWVAGMGHHEVDSVVAAVDALAPAPHILALSGTIGLRLFSDRALLELTQQLNKLLPGNDFYYPFLSDRPETRNPPGLWLSARYVDLVADHRPPHEDEPRSSDEAYDHTVETFIAGRRIWLKAVHWPEYDSPQTSVTQSAVDSQLATVPAILLGDFAARPDTEAPERLLQAGFWDVGQAAAELGESAGTPDGHAVEHILVSRHTPARLVPGSYVVGVSQDGSTSAGVACDLDFERAPATEGPRAPGSPPDLLRLMPDLCTDPSARSPGDAAGLDVPSPGAMLLASGCRESITGARYRPPRPTICTHGHG